ncbi:hypothetical protein [Hyalangium versicolor]|uniref:hypothetical protein n=1 Tax=Hyalangium versicolor TaxID=2861190 RepID=UPI001CC96F69|nr:hypothetical protein [Hyalangium versicolor]
MRRALAVGILAVSALVACGDSVEPCLEPPAGSRSDVTLAFDDQTGFAVAECPNPPSDFNGLFLVRGTTGQRLFEDRAPDDLIQASDFDMEVVSKALHGTPSFHQSFVSPLRGNCDRTADPKYEAVIVFLSDWADVDSSLERIGHALNEAALGETVLVAVHPPFCAD